LQAWDKSAQNLPQRRRQRKKQLYKIGAIDPIEPMLFFEWAENPTAPAAPAIK
jgi:hypothetical protein